MKLDKSTLTFLGIVLIVLVSITTVVAVINTIPAKDSSGKVIYNVKCTANIDENGFLGLGRDLEDVQCARTEPCSKLSSTLSISQLSIFSESGTVQFYAGDELVSTKNWKTNPFLASDDGVSTSFCTSEEDVLVKLLSDNNELIGSVRLEVE